MSWEVRWRLPGTELARERVERAVAEVLTRLRLRPRFSANAHGFSCLFAFPPERIDALIELLFAGVTWREDVKDQVDPLYAGEDQYLVSLEFLRDEHPVVSLYSNDGHNRACWPIAEAIAMRIAERLGGVDERDIKRDPEEAMNWNRSAVLKPTEGK
jgi:hypothetical protein